MILIRFFEIIKIGENIFISNNFNHLKSYLSNLPMNF
jgi:hypothetical protein